jgi:glycosyltransferase 2 family protein
MVPTSIKHYFHIALGLIVTAICLWLAIPGSDLVSKQQGLKTTFLTFQQADYWWLVPLMALLAVFFWIKFYRWRLLLSPLRSFTTYEVVPATMIGFMGNNLLPAHLGEFMRMYVLGRTYKVSQTAVLSSIVLERVLDAIAIMFFFIIAVFSVDLPSDLKWGGLLMAAAAMLAIGLLVVFVFRTEMILRIWKKNFSFLPEKIHQKLTGMIETSVQGLQTFRHFRRLTYVIFLSIIHWGILGIYIYLSLAAFSIRIPVTASFLVLAVTMVGVIIPAAPGYWGTLQACFILGLRPFGVPQEAALASSLYYHISQYVPITLIGLIYMVRLRLDLNQVRTEADSKFNLD